MSDQEPNLEDLFNNSFDQELAEFWQEMEKEVEEEEALAVQAEDENSFLNWMGGASPNEQINTQQPSKSRNSSEHNLDETLWEGFQEGPSTAQKESAVHRDPMNLDDWFLVTLHLQIISPMLYLDCFRYTLSGRS